MMYRDKLFEKNIQLLEFFKCNPVFGWLNNTDQNSKDISIFLNNLYLFSVWFQKFIKLRAVFCDSKSYFDISHQHLVDEFNHNVLLKPYIDDNYWNPMIDSAASWFAWKMISLDNLEKTFLMHKVLESAGHYFFTVANNTINKFLKMEFFSLHSDVDGCHENQCDSIFDTISKNDYENILILQKQGWEVIGFCCKAMVSFE